MPRAHLLVIAAVAAVVALAGCEQKKKQQTGPGPVNSVNISVKGGQIMPATVDDNGVSRYSDEGPEIGTVLTNKVTLVRRAAEPGGEILHRLGPGTGVNKRARHGPYFLVDYPVAPGQMKPGWVLQDDVGSAARPATPTATPTPVRPIVPGRK